MKEFKGMIYKGIDFSNNFLISNYGDIYNKQTNKYYKIPTNPNNQKITISLGSRENKITINLGYVVAENFLVPKKNNQDCLIHINGDLTNHYYKNLKWGTRKELYRISKKVCHKGEYNHQHKLRKKDVDYIRKNCIPYSKKNSMTRMAKKFNVSISDISRIVNFELWK